MTILERKVNILEKELNYLKTRISFLVPEDTEGEYKTSFIKTLNKAHKSLDRFKLLGGKFVKVK